MSETFGGPDILQAIDEVAEYARAQADWEVHLARDARHPAPHEARAAAYTDMAEWLRVIVVAEDKDSESLRHALWALLLEQTPIEELEGASGG